MGTPPCLSVELTFANMALRVADSGGFVGPDDWKHTYDTLTARAGIFVSFDRSAGSSAVALVVTVDEVLEPVRSSEVLGAIAVVAVFWLCWGSTAVGTPIMLTMLMASGPG